MNIIRSALDAYANGIANKFGDRSNTVGASDVGQCARKTYWLKNEGDPQHGAPRDPDYVDSWGARMRGTVFEDQFWEPALRAKFGERLLFAGKEQKTFVSGFLSATPDGLLLEGGPDGKDCMVECKTADPRTNLSEAKAENVYQTHIQMGLVRELTQYKPTHSILSYTDASFWSEGKEFVIPFDQKVFDAGKARAVQIMTATDAAELKPEGYISGGRECEYCPFTRACGIERRKGPTFDGSADPQFVAEIADLAGLIRRLEIFGKQNDAELREAQEQMRQRLRAKGVRKIANVVTWSAVKGRESWDNKAIREALEATGEDMSQFSTIGEPTDRLQITLPKSGSNSAADAQDAEAA